jgi:hypothetical protein
VLRDDADQPRYVQTVPREGYRLIAPVEVLPPAGRTCRILASRRAGSGSPPCSLSVSLPWWCCSRYGRDLVRSRTAPLH